MATRRNGQPKYPPSSLDNEKCVPSFKDNDLLDNDSKSKERGLKTWKELPSWQQEGNHYIETGYRPISGSITECLHSWTYIHNESVNIYTHVIGALIFVALPFYIFRKEIPPRYAIATQADIAVCCIYFFGVAICFSLSVLFHTIWNHSHNVAKLGMKLDLQGIILLMWGSTVPLIYYGFYCDSRLREVYWSLLTIFAIFCSYITFHPEFSNPHLRHIRAATFTAFAVVTIIPVLHSFIIYGWAASRHRMGLPWMVWTIICNGIGAGAYASKFPERWHRRRFDIWGASHQWLHIMVVLAGLTHAIGVVEAFDFLHREGGACL